MVQRSCIFSRRTWPCRYGPAIMHAHPRHPSSPCRKKDALRSRSRPPGSRAYAANLAVVRHASEGVPCPDPHAVAVRARSRIVFSLQVQVGGGSRVCRFVALAECCTVCERRERERERAPWIHQSGGGQRYGGLCRVLEYYVFYRSRLNILQVTR